MAPSNHDDEIDESRQHLLERGSETGPLDADDEQPNTPSHGPLRTKLYISHTLSTFNSRAFEFGAFLFLAIIYPQTLLPASVYALARAGSAALCSPVIGRYIDSEARLRVLRLSIFGQRVPVALSCVLLLSMFQFPSLFTGKLAKILCLGVLSLLACVEKLGSIMNTIAVERDWVVVIAENDEGALRAMNSQMRRIDLFSKLVAPLCVSLLDTASTQMAIVILCAFALLSLPVEYFAIARVYQSVPSLRRVQAVADERESRNKIYQIRKLLAGAFKYATHPAFFPSFALALLYLTVLSFNGQMITYLLALGLPSALIGALRGISAVSELSATWIAPKVTAKIGAVRSGIWFINYQIFWVTVACICLWMPDLSGNPNVTTTGWVTALIAAVVLSRVGLWGFDLSVQIIVQEEVESESRGSFSSQEFAAQNIFEMLSFASTIVFANPMEFKVPATISACAVAMAGVLYACFVRARRGHLVHLSRCIDRKDTVDRRFDRGDDD